jgi:nucleotide-binding universal stress UspA family protein
MDQLQDALSQLGANLAQDGVRSQTLFCPTDAMAETVLEKAGELQPDLLIITAQLATTSDNFFIGPFTQQIIHNARIPVLSVHPESLRESNGRLYSGQHNQTDSDLDLFDL